MNEITEREERFLALMTQVPRETCTRCVLDCWWLASDCGHVRRRLASNEPLRLHGDEEVMILLGSTLYLCPFLRQRQ